MFRRRFSQIRYPSMSTRNASSSRRRPKLPRLPVPDLHQTLERYITSLEPLILEDERLGKATYESAYAQRLDLAREFGSGIGLVLQDRLIALDRASPNNWLNDNIWLEKAYLEWRLPLIVNSNWWLAFRDDELIPHDALTNESNKSSTGITLWQVRRAASLIRRVLEFKAKVDAEGADPETTRTGIWLRENVSKMFNIARIPLPRRDSLSSSPSPDSPDANKLLLAIHNWFYTIPVYHSPNSANEIPQLMSIYEIESRIRAVVVDVEKRLRNGEKPLLLGALSADDRDVWARNQSYLLSLHPENKRTYQKMLSSVMALSLEHATHTTQFKSRFPSTSPTGVSQQILDAHLHTIRAQSSNFANRFYDKPLTIIVDPSARAGATGEHSPCDALVPSIVAEYGIAEGVDVIGFEMNSNNRDPGDWERLDWVTDDTIRKECEAAYERAVAIIKDSDDSVLWFEDYGADWIKSTAQLAPDAYIQMALQLAWYRTRGEFTATYETVLTRMFKHGRTETVRTLTRDSRAWVLSMMDPQSSIQDRYTALRRAIQNHSRLTKQAATGRGIDRHLLGLRLMLRPHEGEKTPFFEDEMFERSQQWKLSTSGLSAGHLFRGTGFGSPYHDGYGINYLAGPNMIKFGIESKFSSPVTSTDVFKKAVTDTLHEMKLICSSPEAAEYQDISPRL